MFQFRRMTTWWETVVGFVTMKEWLQEKIPLLIVIVLYRPY
jgi:hypothetical protein